MPLSEPNLRERAPEPLDASAVLKGLKSRQLAEGLANIRIGLEEDRLDPIRSAPIWLQLMYHLTSSSPPKDDSDFPGKKVVPFYEHHIRPPQFTWCGMLHRNACPKKGNLRAHERDELTTIRVIPYYETYDKKLQQSPAEKLKAFEQMIREGREGEVQSRICLTGRICPDMLRQNFYELLEALKLRSHECLLGIMSPLPSSRTAVLPTDDQLLRLLASKMTHLENTKEFARLLDLYTSAWSRLKGSDRLKETPVPVRVLSAEFTLAEIIDSFRLTLPANKRIYCKRLAPDSPSRSAPCDICQQCYCEGHYDHRVSTNESPRGPDWRSPSPDVSHLDIQPVDTDGYVPCTHGGKCFDNEHCDCHGLNTYCDRFCRCPEDCPRRYPGCSCVMNCDEKCPCVIRSRECDPLICGCPTRKSTKDRCSNFLVATKKKRTFVGPSKIAGLGVFAGEPISTGDYLGEYTGVLLRADEIEIQSVITSLSKSSYLFDLNQVDVVDSSKFGNRTRFINEPASRKRPNADPHVWYVAGSQVMRIFANKKIRVGDEITMNYGEKYHDRDWS
ncbi:hypothetical protein Pst134EB_006221 [Puccinia striiformis f. sp. tritici]|nr:hypothetical protein Pst134EB_006221 [Puccinia striiformis f. sp. tritici]